MKRINILYWTVTSLFAFAMLGSAIPNLLVLPISVQGFNEMDMPLYLIPFVGVAKVLGVVAILIPGYPRIKEWAYAGLTFDLVGAAYSVMSIGKSVENYLPIMIICVVGLISYFLYHKRTAMSPEKKNQVATSNIEYTNEGRAAIA